MNLSELGTQNKRNANKLNGKEGSSIKPEVDAVVQPSQLYDRVTANLNYHIFKRFTFILKKTWALHKPHFNVQSHCIAVPHKSNFRSAVTY